MHYVIAVAIYQIYSSHFFDFGVFRTNVLSFVTPAHCYFLFFYIQLLLIERFLFGILKKYNTLIVCIIVLGTSIVFSYFTVVDENLYGGAKYILGGTYFFLFSWYVFGKK